MDDGPFSFIAKNVDGLGFGLMTTVVFSGLGGLIKKAGIRAIGYGLGAAIAIQAVVMPLTYKLWGWGWEHWAAIGIIVGLTASMFILTVTAVAEGVFKRNPDITAAILKRVNVAPAEPAGKGD